MIEIINKNSHSLYEMATIGSFGKKSKYEVRVYGNEGRVPHMHITEGPGDNLSFDCCIKLRSAEYFHHDSKKINNKVRRNDKLDSNEISELIIFLNSLNSDLKIPNWQIIITMWNTQNKGNYRHVDINSEIPDYSMLSSNTTH